MQPSDRSKGAPKMTIGPLPTPPGGVKAAPPRPPAEKTGAPAVGTGILGGGGLAFGPTPPPPQPKTPPQGPVFVARPAAPQPAPHQPLPMRGVMDAYANGARRPDSWPTQTPQQPPRPAPAPQPAAARPAPAPAPKPAPLSEPAPAIEPAAEPGPPPAWMAAAETRAAGPNRTRLFIGGAALVAVVAIGGVVLLNRRAPEPAATAVSAPVEQIAPAPTPVTTPTAEPLRQAQEVASLEAPPVSAPAPVKVRKTEPARTVAVRAPVEAAQPKPGPVQVEPQPLAVPPPAPAPVVQQPAPTIVIPHIDPSAPIATRSSADQ